MAAATSRHDRAAAARSGPGASAIADLHTHTTRSDGRLIPIALAEAAAAAGVRLLAITDHDALAGVRDVLADPRRPPGLEVVAGVEMNAVVDRPDLLESEIHILGLGIDLDDAEFEAVLVRQRDRRRARFERMVARLRDIGLPIDDALVADPPGGDEHALGRPIVARSMLAKGYVASVSDAFDRYLSRGRPGYVAREGLGPIEVIRAIRGAHGIPVLAHFAEAPERLDVITELVAAGLAGIEVHYRSYSPDQVDAVAGVARAFGLLASGGTDFHGDRESYAEAHAALWLPDEAAEIARAALAGPR